MQTQIQRKPDPNQTILLARIVWAAMLASVGTLYFVAYMDESKQETIVSMTYAEIFSNQMVQMLFLQAIVIAFAAFFLPKVIAKRNQGSGSKIAKGFLGLIVRLALSDTVQVLGLVAYFTMHTTRVMHPFTAIAALLMLISFPTEELLEDFAS
jgi:hypothetical protein